MNDSAKKTSVVLQGIVGSKGACVAKSYVFKKRIDVKRTLLNDNQIEAEIERLERAVKMTAADIIEFQKLAKERHGDQYAAIFDSHLLMLEDPQFKPQMISRVKKEKVNVESIVADIVDKLQSVFSAIEDPYLRERAIDIKDVGDRLLRHLMGLEGPTTEIGDEPYILVAAEISPSEILDFAKGKLRGVCLDTGGATSHVAILAGALGIPSVFGLANFSVGVHTGDTILMDTRDECRIILHPSKESIDKLYDELKNEFSSKLLSNITADGVKINIAANVARTEELETLQKAGIKRIGLFRSEFVFMESMDVPSEKFQQEIYTKVVKAAPELTVLRTIDIGSDKPLRYLPLGEEMNPAMGFRSVRFSLSRKDILVPQLKAMIKAASGKNCKIIFPMVSVPSELKAISELYSETVAELRVENPPEWGIMLEVPSASFMLSEIAKYTKYISIGTNDLLQFFYAVDRTNERLAGLIDYMGISFLRLLHATVQRSHELGITVGVCGEMAGDPAGFVALLGMGVRDFSMRPAVINKILSIIPKLNEKEVSKTIDKLLSDPCNFGIRETIENMFLPE